MMNSGDEIIDRSRRRSFLRTALVQLLPWSTTNKASTKAQIQIHSGIPCVPSVEHVEALTPKPLYRESDLNMHRLESNPEAMLFSSAHGSSTEQEYLDLLTMLVGVFKPTHILETGTRLGIGTAALIKASRVGTHVWTINRDEVSERLTSSINELADSQGVSVEFITANSEDLMNSDVNIGISGITAGKATFLFLDTAIDVSGDEFAYFTDPTNEVLDFTRPICVCIHDMSRYRHPYDADTSALASCIRRIEKCANERAWEFIRFHQSRGMFVLVKYPDHPGIDGKCIVPDALLFEGDRRSHIDGPDPYLITDYYPILADLVRKKAPTNILEIGLRYGYSFAVALDASPTIDCAFAVDSSVPVVGWISGAFEQTKRTLEQLQDNGRWPNLKCLEFIDCDTRAVVSLPICAGTIDFAYVDGDTSPEACLHDLQLVLPLLADGAILVVDDIHHCRLRAPVSAWADSHGLPYREIPDSSGRGRLVITRVADSLAREKDRKEVIA